MMVGANLIHSGDWTGRNVSRLYLAYWPGWLGPNQRCSLDFVSDTLISGRRIRILAAVVDFTREYLALVVDTSPSRVRVAPELDAIIATRGMPSMIVSDNGTELTSLAILRWIQKRRVD